MAILAKNINSRPWRSWHVDERWQIMAEYQRGLSVSELAKKYNHPVDDIVRFLQSKKTVLGISCGPKQPTDFESILKVDIQTGKVLVDRMQEVLGYDFTR